MLRMLKTKTSVGSYLICLIHFQFVCVLNYSSERKRVSDGVPQGSVLGTIRFNIHILPLGNITRKPNISIDCYSDDTQLHLSIEPDEAN